jgi:hypothetical protein
MEYQVGQEELRESVRDSIGDLTRDWTWNLGIETFGSGGEYLNALFVMAEVERCLPRLMNEHVRLARENDLTWREIGHLLGTTREAAYQRFGQRRRFPTKAAKGRKGRKS